MRAILQTYGKDSLLDHICRDASVKACDHDKRWPESMRQRWVGEAARDTDLCTRHELGRQRSSFATQQGLLSSEAY